MSCDQVLNDHGSERGNVWVSDDWHHFLQVQDLNADLLFKDLLKALMDQDCPKISSLVPVLMVALVSFPKTPHHAQKAFLIAVLARCDKPEQLPTSTPIVSNCPYRQVGRSQMASASARRNSET